MPYGGIYFAIDKFNRHFACEIDCHLGLPAALRYQYSEIVMAMMCDLLCGAVAKLRPRKEDRASREKSNY